MKLHVFSFHNVKHMVLCNKNYFDYFSEILDYLRSSWTHFTCFNHCVQSYGYMPLNVLCFSPKPVFERASIWVQVIGKALVLDEIINYIQSLQRQVEVCLLL